MQIQQMQTWPLVSVVIPHIGKSKVLYRCLQSLAKTTYLPFELIVVDNGSDLSLSRVQGIIPRVQVVCPGRNLGFAGGCNAGIRHAQGKYVVLLNNDTVVDEDWLSPLVTALESDDSLAAAQPKILSLWHTGFFDYAGGMGGLMDLFGYPFVIGRIFESIEKDQGQYDRHFQIFWVTGTACLWRRSVLQQIGMLDADFFAHMEEIDLNWRAQLLGYRVVSISESLVYHYSGWTLSHQAYRKMYLNHRNSLIMMLKNYDGANLLWIFPYRILAEWVTVLFAMVKLDFKRVLAVPHAFLYILLHLPSIIRKRCVVQSKRQVSDTMLMRRLYRGSLVWQYFILRKRYVSELEGVLHWLR